MTGDPIHRRSFLTLLGRAAAAWPVGARAQQGERVRHIALLMGGGRNDPVWQGRVTTVREDLAKVGWIEGHNLRIDLRFGEGDASRMRTYAEELVRLGPEVILAASGAAARALQQETRTIPIVVAGAGPQENTPVPLVRNIARPEGNITAFPVLYPSIAGKWLELLKEAAPAVGRVAVMVNPDTGSATNSYSNSIDAAAQVFSVKTIDGSFHNSTELFNVIDAFAAEPNGGLIVLPGAGTATRDNRQSILLLASRFRLPTIHWDKLYPAEGGLMSYGSDWTDLHRRAASYIDRLLRGAKINELPVQYPTKFELVVNLKAAKAIGLTIPETFLLRADEVIE